MLHVLKQLRLDSVRKIPLELAFFAGIFLIIVGVFSGGSVTREINKKLASNDAAFKQEALGPLAEEIYAGSPSARIVVLEYFDLECPYCKIFFEEHHHQIQVKYRDASVAFALRQYPLRVIHPRAVQEAKVFTCIRRMGLERDRAAALLFDIRAASDEEIVSRVAVSAPLNPQDIQKCVNEDAIIKAVADDIAKGALQGVVETPMFIIYKDGIERARVAGAARSSIDRSIDALLGEI